MSPECVSGDADSRQTNQIIQADDFYKLHNYFLTATLNGTCVTEITQISTPWVSYYNVDRLK